MAQTPVGPPTGGHETTVITHHPVIRVHAVTVGVGLDLIEHPHQGGLDALPALPEVISDSPTESSYLEMRNLMLEPRRNL